MNIQKRKLELVRNSPCGNEGFRGKRMETTTRVWRKNDKGGDPENGGEGEGGGDADGCCEPLQRRLICPSRCLLPLRRRGEAVELEAK